MEKKQDKLLILGVDSSTRHVLEYCREIGVHTIVTDYIPYEKSAGKKLADEHWEIDVSDVDTLERKCREENITGVFSGNSEYCLDRTHILAKRLGKPFYASDLGWQVSRDKRLFKEYCMAAGLNVPKEYSLRKPFTAEMLAELEYPIMIKPADSSGSRGIVVCRSEEELDAAYDYALSYSATKSVIVEEFVEGVEVVPVSFIVDGKVQFNIMQDIIYSYRTQGNNMGFDVGPSKYMDLYLAEYHDKVQALADRLDAKFGQFYFEAIYAKGKLYFLELIYRIDGVGLWTVTDRIRGTSIVRQMVNYALGYPAPQPRVVENPYKCGGIFFYWCKPGKVGKIVGMEEIQKRDDMEIVLCRYQPGDVIKESNDMVQMGFYLGVTAMNRREFAENLKFIVNTLKIYDEDGNELTDPTLPLEKLPLDI